MRPPSLPFQRKGGRICWVFIEVLGMRVREMMRLLHGASGNGDSLHVRVSPAVNWTVAILVGQAKPWSSPQQCPVPVDHTGESHSSYPPKYGK